MRTRVIEALRNLSVQVYTYRTMSCNGEPRWYAIECASVANIVGQVTRAPGRAIVLMAHMDSAGAGPGAADDGANVATILETIRAWKARGQYTKHPILVIFTDGEEIGMLGASALMADPSWRERIGIVVNLEARGNKGRSYLFQTSPNDHGLINLYAKAVDHPAASSLYSEIYRRLPNDTDMTPFLNAGMTGYNFAFIGNVAQYHTPLDRRENLDLDAVQSQGEATLGLLTKLASTDFAMLQTDGNSIYFDVLGRWFPRLNQSWSLPLSIAALAITALAAWLTRSSDCPSLWSIAMAPLLLIGAVAAGYALHQVAVLVSGYPDPSFAHLWSLRLALAFGLWSVALLVSRLNAGPSMGWLWITGLGVTAAVLLPGVSPYFLFPSLLAAPLLLISARMKTRIRYIAAAIAAFAASVTWINLAANGEAVMGLAAHPIFTTSVAMSMISVVPLLRSCKPDRSPLIAGGLSCAFAVIAGFLPVFSPIKPERLNLRYIESDGKAYWAADPVPRLPPSLANIGSFTSIGSGTFLGRQYMGPAGAAEFSPPRSTAEKAGMQISIKLNGSNQASGMILSFPKEVILSSVNGRSFPGLPPSKRVTCNTPDCANAVITVEAGDIHTYDLAEIRYGLPSRATALLAERPKYAVPAGSGDQTFLISRNAVQ